jgi:hypothetical protein
MSTNNTARVRAVPAYTDDTGPRIRAYLASVRPLRGVSGLGDDQRYQRGRSAIERLALSAAGEDSPTHRLSVSQCADVAYFVSSSEPLDARHWWQEPRNAPSHVVGFHMVMDAVEAALRPIGGRS